MSEEARARLREAAEAKKGRKNLKSLDRTLGMVAFDYVQEFESTLPRCELTHRGLCRVGDEFLGIKEKNLYGDTYFEDVRLSTHGVKGDRASTACDWVRLQHAAGWQIEEFVKRFAVRYVAHRVYQGPNKSARWDTIALHPLKAVIAWLKFLWDKPTDLGEKACKYVVGFTNRCIHDHPGVGAKVFIKRIPTSAVGHLWKPCQGIVTSLATADTLLGRPIVHCDANDPAHLAEVRLDPGDEWEILP